MYTRNAVVVLFAPGRFAIQVWADLEFRTTTLIGQMLAQLMDKQDIFVSTSQQLLQPGGSSLPGRLLVPVRETMSLTSTLCAAEWVGAHAPLREASPHTRRWWGKGGPTLTTPRLR